MYQLMASSLPPEIRNMIWKLCLFHPESLAKVLSDRLGVNERHRCFTMKIDPHDTGARPKLREAYESSMSNRSKRAIRELSFRNLALMETCRAIYDETAPVLWSQRFNFQSISHLQAFLFSNARLDLVRSIWVHTMDATAGVNYMPSVCALLAAKVKHLESFDIDLSCIHKKRLGKGAVPVAMLGRVEDVRKAGVDLGFDVYSCMHPWVTEVVRDQGVERLISILQITREAQKPGVYAPGWPRAHFALRCLGPLTAFGHKIMRTAAADEICRLVNLYKK
jgi:hypothetical protein